MVLQHQCCVKIQLCVYSGVGGFPSWVPLLKDSESSLLCTWLPPKKRSKDALGVSFIQASWKKKSTQKTEKASQTELEVTHIIVTYSSLVRTQSQNVS